MKIGLYFGSFNPIHTGHLIISNFIANLYVDKIWFIVSPQNPLKNSDNLLKSEYRLNLVKLAIEDDERFEISDIEFFLPTPSYTITTLQTLSQNYPQHKFFIIMGSDNFQTIPEWKSSSEILKNYTLLVYERQGFTLRDKNIQKDDVIFVDAPLLNISSTVIREMLTKNESIRYLVPAKVYQSIKENGYFK